MKNLTIIRKRSKMTIRRLACLMEVDENSVYRWEAGLREPSLDRLKRLARILSVSVDELVGTTLLPEGGRFMGNPRQEAELMPEGLLEAIPHLEDLEGVRPEHRTALVRYKAGGNKAWVVLARRRGADRVFHGWIGGSEPRLGLFSLKDLEEEHAVRDAEFIPQPLADVLMWEGKKARQDGRFRLDHASVDSGQLILVAPGSLRDWKDGLYPVYATKENGRIVRIEVEMPGEEEEEEG